MAQRLQCFQSARQAIIRAFTTCSHEKKCYRKHILNCNRNYVSSPHAMRAQLSSPKSSQHCFDSKQWYCKMFSKHQLTNPWPPTFESITVLQVQTPLTQGQDNISDKQHAPTFEHNSMEGLKGQHPAAATQRCHNTNVTHALATRRSLRHFKRASRHHGQAQVGPRSKSKS